MNFFPHFYQLLQHRNAKTHAFTLVEILIAMGIGCILLGLLFVTLGPLLEKAKQASSIGRLRQLGVALQVYASDNQLQLLQPRNDPQSRWPILLAPYLGLEKLSVSRLQQEPIFRCPTQSKYRDARGIYGYNILLEESESNPVPVRLTVLNSPASFPVLATTDGSTGGGQRLSRGGPPEKAAEFGYSGPYDRFGPSPNFESKGLFLFADWHVAAHEVCNRTQWPWNDPLAFHPR